MPLSDQIPKIIDQEVLFDGYFQLRREKLLLPNQQDYDYFVLAASPIAVMVLPTTPEGKYVLNWEYRHPTGKVLLSCPGGVKDEGEEPSLCAERELLEETGYKAEIYEKMGEAYPFPGVAAQKTVYFRAHNARPHTTKSLDHAEILETILLTPEELKGHIRKGTPIDGLLLSALALASI